VTAPQILVHNRHDHAGIDVGGGLGAGTVARCVVPAIQASVRRMARLPGRPVRQPAVVAAAGDRVAGSRATVEGRVAPRAEGARPRVRNPRANRW